MSSGKSAKRAAERQITMQQEEEARKADLRKRVGHLFGEGDETEQVVIGYTPTTGRGRLPPGQQGDPIYETRATPVPEARKQFEGEETELGGALRGRYGDELSDTYAKTERATRFGAANTGNTGGSVFADAQGELEKDRRLGDVRIEDSVQRALAGLRASRDDAKLRAIQLVNQGAGESAVQAARSGIRSSIDTAKSGQREQLFTDLFQDISLAKQGSNARDRNAEALALFAGLRNRGLGAGAGAGASEPRIFETN